MNSLLCEFGPAVTATMDLVSVSGYHKLIKGGAVKQPLRIFSICEISWKTGNARNKIFGARQTSKELYASQSEALQSIINK